MLVAQADRQPTVFVHWTMGPTDDNFQFCGWNIDDIVVRGELITGADGDCNVNGVPDECDMTGPGDIDADGYVAFSDFRLLSLVAAGPMTSPDVALPACEQMFLEVFDVDGDDDLDIADVAGFQARCTMTRGGAARDPDT